MPEIKERPILFSAPMVRAILVGEKTVTRRVFKPHQIPEWSPEDPEMGMGHTWHAVGQQDRRYGFMVSGATEQECAEQLISCRACPYGQPGDRLWVRETTEIDEKTSPVVTLARYAADGQPVIYRSTEDHEYDGTVAHWDYPRRTRPSIHMPRWASRILLEITDVRVERLQAISASQAEAEGIQFLRAVPDLDETMTPEQLFECLWDYVNGEDAWAANPWVWVIEFKRVMP